VIPNAAVLLLGAGGVEQVHRGVTFSGEVAGRGHREGLSGGGGEVVAGVAGVVAGNTLWLPAASAGNGQQ
jgi:hypothetical protein